MIRKDEAGADCWGGEGNNFAISATHSLTHSEPLTLVHIPRWLHSQVKEELVNPSIYFFIVFSTVRKPPSVLSQCTHSRTVWWTQICHSLAQNWQLSFSLRSPSPRSNQYKLKVLEAIRGIPTIRAILAIPPLLAILRLQAIPAIHSMLVILVILDM